MNPLTLPQIGPACAEGQGFGKNFNPSYHDGGLLGHTGIDVNCGWASPIEALCDGIVYSTYPIEHPASDGYTAVFTLCETPLEVFEFSYGHVSEIDCQIGQQIKKGDVIAKEGNHGTVYSGNTLITLAMQAAGDHDGHHRHYQKRPCIKTRQLSGTSIQDAQGTYRDAEGYYYQVFDHNNGFAGCIDWTQPLFPRDLSYGMSAYDVYLLQKAIVLEGCGTFTPNGNFGPATLAGTKALQTKHGISATGFCGPLTRGYLNNVYHQLSS
jgi:peptidoglycan hydrolase-like protein with peptidoglycan-binding domain